MKLKIERQSNRTTSTVELKYRLLLKITLEYSDSLSQFAQGANTVMKQVKTGNHIHIETLYQVVENKDSVEVWHLNIQGNRDRLVMKVVQL